MNQKRIAVLMTVHNRKDKTVTCLRHLFNVPRVFLTIEVYLTDDACTDGTVAAVKNEYPS